MQPGPIANTPGAMPGMPMAMQPSGGGFPGAGQAMASAGGNLLGSLFGSETQGNENSIRGALANFMATNPHAISRGAAKGDISKMFLGDAVGAGAITPEAWKGMGSSNENLLGMNKGIEDFVKMAGFEGTPWWKKVLKTVVPMALSAMIPGGGGGA